MEINKVTAALALAGARPAVTTALLAVIVTGCSGSVEVDLGKMISADDLAERVQTLVEEDADIEIDSPECADDLAAKQGAEVRCSYQTQGYEVGGTVTSKGGDGKITWKADDQPTRMLQELLEEKSSELLTQIGNGQVPDAVDCPEEGLRGEIGAIQRCTLTAGEDTLGFTTIVTESGKQGIAFDLEVDNEPS